MFTFLTRFCTIAGVATVLVSSMAIGLVPSEAKAVDVGTVIVIRCPESVPGRINWPNKIGSDPAFSPAADNTDVYTSFVSISRYNQIITCSYRIKQISNTQVSGGTIRYNYTAKRLILDCKPTTPGAKDLRCTVKD